MLYLNSVDEIIVFNWPCSSLCVFWFVNSSAECGFGCCMVLLPFPLLLYRSIKGAGWIAILNCLHWSCKYIFKRKKNVAHSSRFCDCNVESLLQVNFPLRLLLVFGGYCHSHLLFKSMFCSFWFRLFLWSRWSLNLPLPAYLCRLRSWPWRGQLRILRLF